MKSNDEQFSSVGVTKGTRNKIKALSMTKSSSMKDYIEQLINTEVQLLDATDYNDYRTILRHTNPRQR